MERERDIEKWLRRQVEGMGGAFLKFTSPGNGGVPDRLAVLPGGRVWFVELKTASGRLSSIQKWQHDRLRTLGCSVIVLYGIPGAARWLEERRKEADTYGVYTARVSETGD